MSRVLPNESTLQDLTKKILHLDLAEKMVMLQDQRQLLADDAELARAVNRKNVGGDYNPPKAEEMGDMFLGDVTIVNEPPREALQPREALPAPPGGGLGTLAKLGIAAALIGTGAGAGIAIPLAISALIQPTAQQQFTDTDTDTNTLFDLVIPEKQP